MTVDTPSPPETPLVKTAATSPQDAEASPSRKAAWLKQVRQLHLYLGTLFAPAIIFFAFSGALQLFGLHEGRPGGSYHPPAWIQRLASIHKDQALSEHHGPPPAFAEAHHEADEAAEAPRPPAAQPGPHREERQPSVFTYLLKWFFALTSLGLIATTLLGIYMSFKYNRSRATVWSLLAAGTAIPIALILLMA